MGHEKMVLYCAVRQPSTAQAEPDHSSDSYHNNRRVIQPGLAQIDG